MATGQFRKQEVSRHCGEAAYAVGPTKTSVFDICTFAKFALLKVCVSGAAGDVPKSRHRSMWVIVSAA